jgi:FkbH-like protein
MKLFLPRHDRHRKLLAGPFRKYQTELRQGMFLAIREKLCASWKAPQQFEQVEEWARSQLSTAVHLLTKWFETSDPLYQELFAGWVHSRVAADLSEEGTPSDYKPGKAVEFAKASWIAILKSRVPAEAIQILEEDLDQVAALLSKQSLRRTRVLFIGDCLQFEVMSALICPCARAQISVQSTFVPERVQPILRNRIRRFNPDEFDLIFFSPFSHTYLPEYEMLLKPESRFWSAPRIANQADAILQEVCSTLDTLAKQFNCPIYVHNTSGTIPSHGAVAGLAKNLVSRRNRRWTREIVNDRIARYLKDPQRESRVQLLDENSLRLRRSDIELGQIHFDSYAFHPTWLGVELGRTLYFEAVYAAALLAAKKVVVCDLDNTLWDGVIGEGAVTQHLDRQAVLKELRLRGVLLSINSKNDPKNVHWSGAVLQPDDFVAPRINWDAKTANMAGIRDELNLKVKDFVFIDDRPDELERMRNAFPEILALNATEPSTWNFLGHWQRGLPSNPQEDRTKQYHERVAREQFLGNLSQASETLEDETAALAALELSVKIDEASRPGLKRAAELINRTNQFNLCGSRTTVRELEDGMGATHWIITAEAADKFGSMGVVGVMRADLKHDAIEIPIFVLSCRAFGFGIEYALLNSVKRLAPVESGIVGHYKETQSNQPCRKLYPASGLRWNGTSWVGKIAELPPDPAWLRIENKIPAKLLPAIGRG